MTKTDDTKHVITVFLLDDHDLVRVGVKDFLETQPDIRVIGEAGTAAAALARIPALRPDVAILDVRLPDGDGVSVCREIRSKMPDVGCLMLTSYRGRPSAVRRGHGGRGRLRAEADPRHRPDRRGADGGRGRIHPRPARPPGG